MQVCILHVPNSKWLQIAGMPSRPKKTVELAVYLTEIDRPVGCWSHECAPQVSGLPMRPGPAPPRLRKRHLPRWKPKRRQKGQFLSFETTTTSGLRGPNIRGHTCRQHAQDACHAMVVSLPAFLLGICWWMILNTVMLTESFFCVLIVPWICSFAAPSVWMVLAGILVASYWCWLTTINQQPYIDDSPILNYQEPLGFFDYHWPPILEEPIGFSGFPTDS